jgi:hypothetical protein
MGEGEGKRAEGGGGQGRRWEERKGEEITYKSIVRRGG